MPSGAVPRVLEMAAPQPQAVPVLPAGQVVRCIYQHEWDNNGVLYFLGRMAAVAALQVGS